MLPEPQLRRQGLRPRKETATATSQGVFRWYVFNRKAGRKQAGRVAGDHLQAPEASQPWKGFPLPLVLPQQPGGWSAMPVRL